MKNTDRYAVFGSPISHSKSPRIHKLFALQTGQNIEYTAHDVPAENFAQEADAFFGAGGKGLNCTVPLKELAWRYADCLTERARLAGAVNTLAWREDGGVSGDNTDGVGLLKDLTDNQGVELQGKRILILGAGGACRGILGPLLECRPAQMVIANRTLAKADNLVKEFSEFGAVASSDFYGLSGHQFDLIINATSASLRGHLPPLPANMLASYGFCYDLAYANQPTAFVEWGVQNGAAKSVDGLGMLVEQAAEAFFLWRGVRPETDAVIAELNGER